MSVSGNLLRDCLTPVRGFSVLVKRNSGCAPWSIWSFEESTFNSCQESKGVSSVIHFVDYSLCRIAFSGHWVFNLNIFFSRTIFRGIKTEWWHFTVLSVCMTPTHSWSLYLVISTPIIFISVSVCSVLACLLMFGWWNICYQHHCTEWPKSLSSIKWNIHYIVPTF